MGLNDELEFKGKKLHIQTENSGRAGTCIITQVFCDGRVVHTAKSFLRDCREARDFAKAESLMHAQHYRVVREIEERKEKITSASQAASAAAASRWRDTRSGPTIS
jgi:hypothetical protein